MESNLWDIVLPIAALVGWFVLQRWLLPRAGVST